MRKLIAILIVMFCLAWVSGCSKKEAPPSAKAARVSATRAFEKYFGPAPTTDKGTCYAFVIFFPSAKEPGKVVPFPFFSFDQPSLKMVALERLMSGNEEKIYKGEFQRPFPKGTRLLALSERSGVVTTDFNGELRGVAANPQAAAALFNAVTLTELQFPGVKAVRIQSEGIDLFPKQDEPEEAAVVLLPSAPRLIKVIAVKEKANAPVTEVDALFDRPVDIKQCRFSTADGRPLTGDVFQSMFDMAAVLKPKEPARLVAGKAIRVRWNVTDKTGKTAQGDDTVPLEVTVHQD